MKKLAGARDGAALLALAALACLRLIPDWARGLSPFWGDLAYLHYGWRGFDAELLAAGRLPLWNPYVYFGMPQAAGMQDGLFYPGFAPFALFRFGAAVAIYHAAHYALAAALAYLALRRLRLRPTASFGASALYALGGLLLGREAFLNHLAVLALAPALVLFFDEPSALAATLALAFFAGYPPLLVGCCAAAWAVAFAAAPRGSWAGASARRWAAAGMLAAALAGVLLLPALELVLRSRRAAGVETGDLLRLAFSPRDLLLWLSPRLAAGFEPATDWWRCCYLGFSGALAAACGAALLPRRRAAALLLALAAVVFLTLGGSNPASAWAWSHLRLLRYPGNLAALAGLPVAVLAGAGLHVLRGRAALTVLICAELSALAWGAMPRAPRALWSSPGPLARALQEDLGGHRYLLSPRALESVSGRDAFEWRQRLYGVSNAPLKLRAAANFGEPLTPRENYALMDALFSARDAASAAAFFPWADVGMLLTPAPVSVPGLSPRPAVLWARAADPRAAGARLLTAAEGEALPAGVAAPPLVGRPLEVRRAREDAFSVGGSGPGWLFVSEPLYPGWSVWLETPLGPGAGRALPALGPFQKLAVPDGAWTAHWRYEPGSFAFGLALTLAAAGLLGAYWYNRLAKSA